MLLFEIREIRALHNRARFSAHILIKCRELRETLHDVSKTHPMNSVMTQAMASGPKVQTRGTVDMSKDVSDGGGTELLDWEKRKLTLEDKQREIDLAVG
jgi:hypothetical protein